MVKIPETLWEPINKAFPPMACVVCILLPDGYSQATPRASFVVLDDGANLGFWNRGGGTTAENLTDGTKVTVYFRDPALRESGYLPEGGVARFYGTAEIHRGGAYLEEVWEKMIQWERDHDPEKKGHAVRILLERVETLDLKPLG